MSLRESILEAQETGFEGWLIAEAAVALQVAQRREEWRVEGVEIDRDAERAEIRVVAGDGARYALRAELLSFGDDER